MILRPQDITPAVKPDVAQLTVLWPLPANAWLGTVQWKPSTAPGTAWNTEPSAQHSCVITGLPAVKTDVRVVFEGLGVSKTVTVTPLPVPPPPAAKMIVGINNGLGWGSQSAVALKAAGITRIRANYDEPTEWPAGLIAAGLTPSVALIGNTDDKTPLASIPLASGQLSSWLTSAVAQADDAVSRCGVNIPLEVGNEMYLKGGRADPVAYARMFTALADRRPSYTLLFSMTGDYARSDGTWSQIPSGGWLADALKAVPALKTQIGGFVSHPYGRLKPVPENDGNSDGPGALPVQHDQAVSLGCARADSWWVTEYGSSYPTAADGDAQDVDCKAMLDYLAGLGYVRGVFWFQTRGYTGMDPPATGAFNDDFSPRPVAAVLGAFAS
jgi:hypothetical protein